MSYEDLNTKKEIIDSLKKDAYDSWKGESIL